jgi:hypothetical protein
METEALEKYTQHKIDVLKRYYEFPDTMRLIEYLVDKMYEDLPHVCKQCGSHEFSIKDEFLGA